MPSWYLFRFVAFGVYSFASFFSQYTSLLPFFLKFPWIMLCIPSLAQTQFHPFCTLCGLSDWCHVCRITCFVRAIFYNKIMIKCYGMFVLGSKVSSSATQPFHLMQYDEFGPLLTWWTKWSIVNSQSTFTLFLAQFVRSQIASCSNFLGFGVIPGAVRPWSSLVTMGKYIVVNSPGSFTAYLY